MIIFDLDNTLRNNDGSIIVVPEDKSIATNWIPWQHWVNEHGTPIDIPCKLFRELIENGHTVGIVTSSSFGTEEWLRAHHLPEPHFIIERALDDNRHPQKYKEDFIIDNLGTITLWVDDSGKVCDFAELNEIPVVRVNSRLGATDYDH